MRLVYNTLVATSALVSLLACRGGGGSDGGGTDSGGTDSAVCGQAPSECSWGPAPQDISTCGTDLCGEFYDCQCNTEQARWEVSVLDCWCNEGRCNPVTQYGCEIGEKCGLLIESAEPLLSRTTCLPEGTVGEGSPCTVGEAGAVTGFDDCEAGYHCTDGTCAPICSTGPPDGCRLKSEPFDEGAYCAVYRDVFDDATGVCEPACHPADDSVVDGRIINARCGEGEGCYLGERFSPHCTATPERAAKNTQNVECSDPGQCLVNGCASGFAPLLRNSPSNPNALLCARYCSPSESHSMAVTSLAGVDGNCAPAALAAVGGTGQELGEHQCRFIQSFSDSSSAADDSLGMCVPVNPIAGGTWSDCRDFDWEAIKSVWSTAIADGSDPQTAFNNFCLTTPSDPDNSPLTDICIGLSRGCISLQDKEAGLPSNP